MTTPLTWRPTTGADSVPYPPMFDDLESPEARAAWARYLIDSREAAECETADEAIVRCRAEADYFEGGADRFELVLDTLTDAIDRHVADLTGPEAEKWRGMGFEESTFVGFFKTDTLVHAHREMGDAWDRLDRDAFRKAAAKFARTLADLAVDMRAMKSEGGAE